LSRQSHRQLALPTMELKPDSERLKFVQRPEKRHTTGKRRGTYFILQADESERTANQMSGGRTQVGGYGIVVRRYGIVLNSSQLRGCAIALSLNQHPARCTKEKKGRFASTAARELLPAPPANYQKPRLSFLTLRQEAVESLAFSPRDTPAQRKQDAMRQQSQQDRGRP
jgi:hypothetical protein